MSSPQSAKEIILQYYEPDMLPIIRAYDEARRGRNEELAEECASDLASYGYLKEFKEDMAKQMIILVGAPASGKSFFVDTTLGKWFKGGSAGLTKSFPSLTFHAKQVESDNALRQKQWEAATEDFQTLQKVETEEDFNKILSTKDFQYTVDGKVVRLADVLSWDSWNERKNKVGNYYKRKGDAVNTYYSSMRGRDSGEWEKLKKEARVAFEDRVKYGLKQGKNLIVIDSAGEDIKSTPFEKFFQMAKDEGFMVSLVELSIPLEMSLRRNEARGKKGRAVPDSQITSAYNAMTGVVKKLRNHPSVDRYVKYVWKSTGEGVFAGHYKVGKDDRKSLNRKISKLKELSGRLKKGDMSQADYDRAKSQVMAEGVFDEAILGGATPVWDVFVYVDAEERKRVWNFAFKDRAIGQPKKAAIRSKGGFIKIVYRVEDPSESNASKRVEKELTRFGFTVERKRMALVASHTPPDTLTEVSQVSLDYLTDKKGVVTVFDRVSKKEVEISGEEGRKLSQELSNADTPQAITGLLGQYTHLMAEDVDEGFYKMPSSEHHFLLKVANLLRLDWKALAERPNSDLTIIIRLAAGMPKMSPQKTSDLIDSLAKKNPSNPDAEYKKWVDKFSSKNYAPFLSQRESLEEQYPGPSPSPSTTGGASQPFMSLQSRGLAYPKRLGGDPPPPPPPPPSFGSGGQEELYWYDFTDIAPDGSGMMDYTAKRTSPTRGGPCQVTNINVAGDVTFINEDELDADAQAASRILSILKENPRQNAISVSEALQMGEDKAVFILKQMTREGLVTDIGGGFVSLPETVALELKTQPVIKVDPKQGKRPGAHMRRSKWMGGGEAPPGGGGVGAGGRNESTEDSTLISFTRGQAAEMLKIMKAVGLSENTEVKIVGENFVVEVPKSLAPTLQERLEEPTT